MTTATTSRSIHSLSQSWSEVGQGNGFSEVNPCTIHNPFDILVVEELVNGPAGSTDTNTANISRLGREHVEEFAPANTV